MSSDFEFLELYKYKNSLIDKLDVRKENIEFN